MEHGSTPLQSSRAGPQVGVGPTAPQAQSLVQSRSRLPPVLPAGPRNYFPVIARAPPPPAACFRPGGACGLLLGYWPPPPLPPGPGRQRQANVRGPRFWLRSCRGSTGFRERSAGRLVPANARHCLDLARRSSQPQQRTHGPRPAGQAHGAAAWLPACHCQGARARLREGARQRHGLPACLCAYCLLPSILACSAR